MAHKRRQITDMRMEIGGQPLRPAGKARKRVGRRSGFELDGWIIRMGANGKILIDRRLEGCPKREDGHLAVWRHAICHSGLIRLLEIIGLILIEVADDGGFWLAIDFHAEEEWPLDWEEADRRLPNAFLVRRIFHKQFGNRLVKTLNDKKLQGVKAGCDFNGGTKVAAVFSHFDVLSVMPVGNWLAVEKNRPRDMCLVAAEADSLWLFDIPERLPDKDGNAVCRFRRCLPSWIAFWNHAVTVDNERRKIVSARLQIGVEAKHFLRREGARRQ